MLYQEEHISNCHKIVVVVHCQLVHHRVGDDSKPNIAKGARKFQRVREIHDHLRSCWLLCGGAARRRITQVAQVAQ